MRTGAASASDRESRGAMTFREGMEIDTSTTSTSGGGGGGGRGIAIGGGIGGLLILVVALLLGVDPSTVAPQTQSGQDDPSFNVSQCKTADDANNILGCRIIATGNSVDAVWSEILGPKYTRPQIRLFS